MRNFWKIVPQGSLVLIGTTAASYALGLMRDRTFAHTFGASRALDAYNAAFVLPDFLLNVFVASGIAAAFVPIFTELFRQDRSKATQYANTCLTTAGASMAIAGIILIVFARPLSFLAAPGFDATSRTTLVGLLRVLAVSPIIFAASNALGAMLISQRRFFFYGLSPILYNLGIMLGTILLAPHFGIMGTALGTLGGALLHLTIRAVDAARAGFRFKLSFTIFTPEFRNTLALMLPKMFGHPVELATFWGFTALASGLAPGSVAILNFARNFQSVPVSLVGIAIATATFPILAEAYSLNAMGHFRTVLKGAFWLIFITTWVMAVITLIVKQPLIQTIFGGGTFGPQEVIRTASLLGVFALVMPTESLVHILARAFYATKNTAIPVVVSILGFCISLGGAWFLIPRFDILAIPFAFFIASALEVIILMTLLSRRIRRLSSRKSLVS